MFIVKVSLTSSCEIVDALEEAANDVAEEVRNDSKEASPAEEVSWMGDSSMTSSQYAQVVFNDIRDTYPLDLDLEIGYTLTSFIQPGHGDRVCLYKLPYLQPHEHVAAAWTKMSQEKTLSVTFPVATLPKEEDFYQVQYLKGDSQVAGASVPFQLRPPGRSHQELCGVTEEDDLMVVQTQQTSLQDKYSSLLDLSEKLTEELNKKNESFIVLEQKNQSLLMNSQKYLDMENDLKLFKREKVLLEQTLSQTTETLNRSESLLNTTTEKLTSVEETLNEKVAKIIELESKIEIVEAKCISFNSDVEILTQERDKLAGMLDLEIKARESLLKEKQELIDRLEDTNALLTATANSKDLAVTEIRSQIEQQDKLRAELARAREEAGHAEAELTLAKQQLERQAKLPQFADNEGDSYVVTTVLSSLGEKLEETERQLREKNEELSLLKQLEASKNSIEIHEKCLEDADTRATDLEKRNQDLSKENEKLQETVAALSKNNDELTSRLEAGAAHYRKLAAEKQHLERNKSSNVEVYVAKIDSLETKIMKLSEELRQARMSQDLQLSEIRTAVGSSSSSSSSILQDRDREAESLETVSDTSNMDSVRIEQAVRSSVEPRVKMPTLFRPLPPATAALPCPLLPENVGPAPAPAVPSAPAPVSLVPELVPRRPAPYSSSSESATSASPDLNCPLCEATFPAAGLAELQRHVNQHMEPEAGRSCPMCSAPFGRETTQRDYEEHVQEHFREQV